jgi:hypothetical protein
LPPVATGFHAFFRCTSLYNARHFARDCIDPDP